MSTVKGKCSICGGCVMDASPAYCSNCGAREAGPADRVIEMVPQRSTWVQPLMVPHVQRVEPYWKLGEITCSGVSAQPVSTTIEVH